MMRKRALWMLRIAIAIIAPLSFIGNIYAASPREQLKQMVVQLQKTPTDNALREKIIKLAQTIKPAPTVPEEAIKYEGRGQFRFKQAKSEQDYVDAAKEYELAVQSAPWVSGYYSDLCTIYEKAGKFAEAKRNCEFALISIADPTLITEIKRRIAGLEVGIETSSPAAIAARKQKDGEELFRKYSGMIYVCRPDDEFFKMADGLMRQYRYSYKVQPNGFIETSETRIRGGSVWEDPNSSDFLLIGDKSKARMNGNRIEFMPYEERRYFELAEDGRNIVIRGSSGEIYSTCYPK